MDWVFYSRNNQEMVDKFTRLGIIESSEVERAFRCVSRAAFVPDDLLEDAFKDTPLRGSQHVHLSAPHMYAAILEELELDVGMSFLNVGSGTGYFSTLVGYIIKKDGINHGIELYEDLVKFANDRITAFLGNGPPDSRDICTPVLIAGNACRLDPDQMKYDRLYCGAACSQSIVKFLLKMVKVGGFLIAPVGSRLIKLNRVSLKEGRQSVINDVSFAPLVDATAEEMKLPKLRFPDYFSKKNRKNSISCDVSFPVSRSPGRKLLAKMRAYQHALECLQDGLPLPMPFCYVPCFEDLCKAKRRQKKHTETSTATTTHRQTENESSAATAATRSLDLDRAAVDTQIDFFDKSSPSSSSADVSQDIPLAESTKQLDDSSPVKKKVVDVDWDYLSTNKTWLEVLEHYYSLCATTDERRSECFNVNIENSDSLSDQLRILSFKKYAKQMGLLPPKGRKKSVKGDTKTDSKGDAPVVEEVANDIVENLLEEVISQVDENDLAENFLAAVTGTGPYSNSDIRRRSSVARAIILDNLPRLRACAEEAGTLSPTLQTLIRTFDDEDKSHDRSEESHEESQSARAQEEVSRETSVFGDMQAFVNNVIADIDKQILHDIASNASVGGLLEEDTIPRSHDPASGDSSLIGQSMDAKNFLSLATDFGDLSKGEMFASVDEVAENASSFRSRKSELNEGAHPTNIAPVKEACQVGITNDVLDIFDKNAKSFVVDLNPDQIFVKKDTCGYFQPSEEDTEQQLCPRICGTSECCSFAPHDSQQKSDSSRLVLLEQRDALHRAKRLGGVRIDDTEKKREEWTPSVGFVMDVEGTKAVEEQKWDGGLVCTELFSLHPERYQLNCCLSSCAEEESFSSLRNPCLGKSTESTPSMPSAFERKPQNFDLSQSPADVEVFSLSRPDPLYQIYYKPEAMWSSGSDVLATNPIVCDTESNFGREAGASFCQLSPESLKDTPSQPTLSDFRKMESKIQQLTSRTNLDSFVDSMETANQSVDRNDNDLSGKDTTSDMNVNRSLDMNVSRSLDMDVSRSLVASTPVHIMPSAESTICKSPNDEVVLDASGGAISKETVHMKSQLPSEKSCISRNFKASFTTHYTTSFKKKRSLRKSFMAIKMDVPSSKMLRQLPGKDWSLKHDKELVLYLSRKEKMSGHVAFSNCCANVINPKCFSSSDLLQYKSICSYPADALARRGIVLKRLAEVLDSVMNMLVGPSLVRDQFRTPHDRHCSLPSFNEASFQSSGTPLNLGSHMSTGRAGDSTEKALYDELTEKAASQSKDLMEIIDTMMQKEIENVRRQKTIARAKLDLYNNLSSEYDEQMRLIKEQLGLVEEQQQLLQNRFRGRYQYENWRQSLQQTEQMIQERKLHKRHVMEQLAAIKKQVELRLAERESVVQIYKQLGKLEKRLIEERTKSTTMGQRYLDDESEKLSNFNQCVERCKEIFNKLTGIGNAPGNDSVAENAGGGDTEEEEKCLDTAKEVVGRSKYRYHPHLLLAKSRFLFPLTSKRLVIIKELLRISETGSLHPCNVARIDRRVPLKERHKYPASNTVFMQMYNALKNKELDYREAKRHFEKLWEVKFIGEGIIDQGGGFRDSLAEMADELCPTSTEVKECLTYFIKTPNQKNGIGDHRDAYIPNPSCNDYHIFTWIGKLIGCAFRTDETFPLAFPPFIWKLLIGDNVTWAVDYSGVDETVVRLTDGIELLAEDTYIEMYGLDQTYTVNLSDGTEQELIANGSQVPVKPGERAEYARLVRKARMLESEKQVKAIRDGLIVVVPEALLSCLTWQDFERGVCGSPEITVNDLKANCRYELDLSPTVDCVSFLWEALASFTSEERSKFIRFVTGRRRLPSPFFISRCSNNDQHLPSASTCGCNLFLPNYTDAKVAAEKLRYAINNCVSIDTDTYPW